MMIRKERLFNIVRLIIVLSGASNVFGDTITISVVPQVKSVTIGSPVSIGLGILGLGDHVAPSLGTFDLNLAFDPTILFFNNVVFGDPILGDQLDPTGFDNTINFVNPGNGTVELFDLALDSVNTLDSLQVSSFILATLTFDTIGVGTSSLDLSLNAVGDSSGNALSASLQNGSASVDPDSGVPEPSSFPLLVIGLAIICRLRIYRLR